MRTRRIILAGILGVVSSWSATACRAQETAKPQSETQPKRLDSAINPYHVEFALTELEDGKKINTRHYSVNINAGKHEAVKIVTQIPLEAHGDVTYIDVGTDINCNLTERENGLGLEAFAKVSSFATHTSPPVLRQFIIQGSTVTVVGKSIVIGSVDDPDSNHQFQLEATVTKLN